jgi:hypothetical protein
MHSINSRLYYHQVRSFSQTALGLYVVFFHVSFIITPLVLNLFFGVIVICGKTMFFGVTLVN